MHIPPIHPELSSAVRGLEHVAIVVPSIDDARVFYVETLGMREGDRSTVPEQKVNVLMVFAGGQCIELVEPASDDSPVSRFLAKRGPGLHHMAYRVDDLDVVMERLKAAGLRLIDEEPRVGAGGTRIAFVHPSSTGGVLTELVEVPE